MRRIKKFGYRNQNLDNAQSSKGVPATGDAARAAWDKFTDKGDLLFHTLLREQFGLCCYTDMNLADYKINHGISSHFEHEQPKSVYPAQTYTDNNLLRSVLSSDDLQHYSGAERFAGHHKLSNYDPSKFISPQSVDCAKYFVYLPDGSVEPSAHLTPDERDNAIYTRDLLNLNAPFLKAEREKWLVEIKNVVDELVAEGSVDALTDLAELELTLMDRRHPDLNQGVFPQLRSFHSATRPLFFSLGERVIAQHCPEID